MQRVLGALGVHLADQDEQQHGVGLQGLQNTLCAKSRGSCVQIRLPVHRRDYADYPKFSSTRLHDYYLHLKLAPLLQDTSKLEFISLLVGPMLIL